MNASTTSGKGWQSIGYDATNFYVHHNSGATSTSTWKIVRISKTTPSATLLAKGTGYIGSAALGSNSVFATLIASNGYSLAKVDKALGTMTAIEGPSTTFNPALLSTNQGSHLLWRTNVSSAGNTTGLAIEMYDEVTGNKPYAAIGGVPLGMVNPSTINLAQSENRSRFIFATGVTASRAFSGAGLVTYDAATRLARTLGILPGSSDFGNNSAIAATSFEPMSLQGGYVAAVNGGFVQSSTLKMYTFDLDVTNSLQYTIIAK